MGVGLSLGAEPRACSSWWYLGSSQQWVRISPCCSAPPGGAELCWAPWGHARPDPGRCVGMLPYVPLKAAKCSVSQCLEGGIHPTVLPSAPHCFHAGAQGIPWERNPQRGHRRDPGRSPPCRLHGEQLGWVQRGCPRGAGIPAWAPWNPSENTQCAPGPLVATCGAGMASPLPSPAPP